jgi:hypothetical protein
MSMTTEKSLASAVKRRDNSITIEGDLARNVIKIHATGSIAWAVCLGAIGVAFAAVYVGGGGAAGAGAAGAGAAGAAGVGHVTFASAVAATGGVALIGAAGVAATTGGVAVAILGMPTFAAAVAIAVAAGGVGTLSTLRNNYKITEQSYNRVVLKRR